MIKFFHNIVPKKNELSVAEMSIFFVKNLHILLIITFIISYFFYLLTNTDYIYKDKYDKVASGYLVPGNLVYEAKLELINSEISEILKFGKLATNPESIIVLTNLKQLIKYSNDLFVLIIFRSFIPYTLCSYIYTCFKVSFKNYIISSALGPLPGSLSITYIFSQSVLFTGFPFSNVFISIFQHKSSLSVL